MSTTNRVPNPISGKIQPNKFQTMASPEKYFDELAPFTLSSTFKGAQFDWFKKKNTNSIELLPNGQKDYAVADYMQAGLIVLEQEIDNKYVKLTADKLHTMWEQTEIEWQRTDNLEAAIESLKKEIPIPEAVVDIQQPDKTYSLFYVPNYYDETDHEVIPKSILVPNDWIDMANEKPVLALCNIMRVSSFARDDYFKRLRTSEFHFSRELRMGGWEDNAIAASKRADALCAIILRHGYQLDQRKHHIGLNLDDYHNKIARDYAYNDKLTIPRSLFYDDPKRRFPKNL